MKIRFFQKIKLCGVYLIVLWIPALMSGGCQPKNEFKTFRIAYAMAPGGTSHLGAEYFKELTEQKSQGKIKVKLYPNGILGQERGLVESLNLRGVDMVIGGPSIIGIYAPKYGLIEAPFLFRDYKHLDQILYGEIGKEMEKAVSKRQGLHFIDFFHRGPRYLTTTNIPVKSPENLEGLKLRVPALPVYIKSWSIFGANPTPIDYSDMFIALKQGVVEGQENPLEVIYTSHLYEVQHYVMETKHLLSFYLLVVGDAFYTKFDKNEQKLLLEASHETSKYHNDLVLEYEKNYQEALIQEGVEFIEVDRSAFEQLAFEKLPPEFKDVWEPGVFKRIINTK